jgi:L-amino acid N-acyltransferase YncA
MLIRRASAADHPAIWEILEPVLRTGETYALPRDMSPSDALGYWFEPAHEVFVATDDGGRILGTYFLHRNQQGGGSHVANCGYITAPWATGRGVARAMCLHSLEHAKARGFRAMQFNFVVSTNERALRLWLSLGFKVVGCLPDAFLHPTAGYVDSFVVFRAL